MGVTPIQFGEKVFAIGEGEKGDNVRDRAFNLITKTWERFPNRPYDEMGSKEAISLPWVNFYFHTGLLNLQTMKWNHEFEKYLTHQASSSFVNWISPATISQKSVSLILTLAP